VQTAILKKAFYTVGKGALGMSLWDQGGGAPKILGTTVLNNVIFRHISFSRKTRKCLFFYNYRKYMYLKYMNFYLPQFKNS
jgi:hypothetical protein